MAKSREERKVELEAIGRKPGGAIELHELRQVAKGLPRGAYSVEQVGDPTSFMIQQILDTEFPPEDSTPRE